MVEFAHSAVFDVRDYECDLQGIVNNANYQHYLEHARHLYLRELGIDFSVLSARGANLVVIRVEIDYLSPLRSGESFVVRSRLERVSRVRFVFVQEIDRASRQPVARAKIFGATMDASGRATRPHPKSKP
ncbi:MAG: acyl-CoA thioesterase [Anaerolineae bacterium]|nr:acyl-CoA thioesterase [Anaerolineae bacterium]